MIMVSKFHLLANIYGIGYICLGAENELLIWKLR